MTRERGKQSIYQLQVQGHLDERWSEWLCGMSITVDDFGPEGVMTTLTGPVADQPELLGILTKLGDLNLTLISVSRVSKGT